MNILIIDDEKPARNLIKEYLEGQDKYIICGEADNGFNAIKKIDEYKPDLILLDIQMPKLTGFEMLELLEDPPKVIFTTAYDQYALKAFEVNAIDYLMKPFAKERLLEALEKADKNEGIGKKINKLKVYNDAKQKTINKIVVKSGIKVKILHPDHVVYISASNDYVLIHTLETSYLKGKTMTYFETNMPDNFLRVHRSTIINIDKISEIQPYKKNTVTIKMHNGALVHASKQGTVLLRKILR
ncbi:MAG: LytR/AlgR family response regulator transcription factor [Bacteroidales bacterium]